MTARRLLIYIIMSLALLLPAAAKTYSVKEIPNVHLADSTRFVTNPDGVLTPAGEQELNSRLRAINGATSAEVVVVAVDDVDTQTDIDDFATELFNQWGVGKKDTKNGLLLLVAKDSHRVVFRTGTGLEGLLPDGLLGTIIRREIAPRFREGDFDGGVNTAISTVSDILTDPDAREQIRSKYANDSAADDDLSGERIFQIYLILALIAAIFAVALLIYKLWTSASKDRHAQYVALDSIFPTILFLTFVTLGMALFALIPLLLIRHRLRRGTHRCPRCNSKMRLMDEEHDNDFLTRAQDLEEQIGSIDYDVWVCPNDGETEIIPYIQRSSAYKECPVCHARTMRVISDRIALRPTATREGIRQITTRCLNCGHQDTESRRIPRETPPVVVIPSGISSGGGGGGIGGGSFGGGFTTGGGASGSW